MFEIVKITLAVEASSETQLGSTLQQNPIFSLFGLFSRVKAIRVLKAEVS